MTSQKLISPDDVSILLDGMTPGSPPTHVPNSAIGGIISDRVIDDGDEEPANVGGVAAFQPKIDHMSSR